MRYSLLGIFILISFSLQAQLIFNLNGAAFEKLNRDIDVGTEVNLIEIYKDVDGNGRAVLNVAGQEETVTLRDLKRVSFETNTPVEFWQNQVIRFDVYQSIIDNGIQYGIRRELEENALEYLGYLNRNNLLFEDEYLENYLQSLLYRLFPTSLRDGRTGFLNIKIEKSSIPNAGVFPNGTVIVSTGLLSALSSENELLAVLAHEVSHYVLDHSIKNINEEIDRQKRAELWASLVTGLAAAVDIYAASNSDYYSPGLLTYGTAVIAYSVAADVQEKLGLQFSRVQELEADYCAKDILEYLNIDPGYLSSALLKIQEYAILTGNYASLRGDGTHPATDDRIEVIGSPVESVDLRYDRNISFVNTYNAALEYNSKHFESCFSLVMRNVDSKVATEDDYLLGAMSTMSMFNSKSKNEMAYNFIQKAKSLRK